MKVGYQMANIKSAKKRIRVIDKKTARNIRVKNHVKDAVKAFNVINPKDGGQSIII